MKSAARASRTSLPMVALTATSLHAALLLFAALAALTACQRKDAAPPAPTSAPASTSSSASAAAAAIQSEADSWFKAIAAKDLDKTLSFYAADAQYLSGGRPAAATPDQRRKLWVEDFATPGFSSDEATTKIEVARSGDLAYQQGTYVSGMQDARGHVTKSSGKFVVVWKRQNDGKWKAVIDIDNADQ
jgi:ketosteroid isomerase-like protein